MVRSLAWRIAALAAALVLSSILAAGCGDEGGGTGGGDQEAPTNPATARFALTIGDLLPLTGDLSPFGPPGRKAADLAVERARDALEEARVDGVDVNIRHADTETNPQAAVSAARRLLAADATCLAGAWASAETIPIAQSVAAPQQTPLVSPASTSAQITTLEEEGFVFRTAPSDNLQGETLADVVEKELGGGNKTVSVAGRNDAYGQVLANSFRRAWEAKGGRLTGGPVLYDPDQPSYTSEAERIVAGDPDAYVIADFPETYARMGAGLVRTEGFDAAKLFVTDGLAGEELPKSIPGEALEGARGTRPGTPEEGDAAEAFDRLYSRSDLAPRTRRTFDAQNFDATILCFLAAVAAGSKEGEAIQGRMRDVSAPPGRAVSFEELGDAVRALRDGQDIDYQGASGAIDLDGQGDPTAASYEVFEYGRNRRFKLTRQVEARQGQGVTESSPEPGRDGAGEGDGGGEGGA